VFFVLLIPPRFARPPGFCDPKSITPNANDMETGANAMPPAPQAKSLPGNKMEEGALCE